MQLVLADDIPGIYMLADHDAVQSYVPHHAGTMSTGFESVIDLLAFIGAFDRCSSFVDEFPFRRIPQYSRMETEMALGIGVKGPAILGVRTRLRTRIVGARGTRTAPLLAVMHFLIAIGFHGMTSRAHRDTLC